MLRRNGFALLILLCFQVISCSSNPVSAPMISGSLPATGTVGTAYTGSLIASGGKAPYIWTVTGLPTGVTPSGTTTTTLTTSGTPTTAGTYSVSATVTDANAKTVTYTVGVVIAIGSSSQTLGLEATPTSNADLTTDITLTATITPWNATSSGTLSFNDNGLAFQAANLPPDSNGVITIMVSNVYAGAHTFSATYTDVNNNVLTDEVSGTYGTTIIPVPPAGSAYVGAAAENKNNGTGPATIADLETSVGRKVVFHLEYPLFSNNISELWTDPANDRWSGRIADDFANGRIPMVSWGCIDAGSTISDITAGGKDAYLHAITSALISISGASPASKVMLRWCWEMNLPVNSKYYAAGSDERGRATEFVAAWQHIVALFRDDFASATENPNHFPLNVVFLFNPGTSKVNHTLSPVGDLYYPGNRYVDWIGLDDYDDNSVTDFSALNGWRSVTPPDQILLTGFYPLYTNSTATGLPVYPAAGFDKPLLIGETGALYLCDGTCSASPTDIQAEYVSSASSEILSEFPQVRSINYFSSSGPTDSWELDGTLASGGGLASYKSMVCSAVYAYSPTVTPYSCQ